MPPGRRFRALFFDLDDTLIDRAAAFGRWLDALGVPATARPALVALDAGGHGDRAALTAALDTHIGHAPDLAAQLPAHIAPAPASAALLADLRTRAGLTVAIVTNGSSATQRAKLAHAGLASSADHVFVAGEVGVAKPSPAIYEHALAHTGCRAEDALFVGDHPILDVTGPAALGLATAWLAHGRAWPDGLVPPSYSLTSLADVARLA